MTRQLRAILREARPKQWMKNVLVFAAPGAAGVLDQPRELGLALMAFVAMSLAASGIYYWNDIVDVESDRQHPTKRFRPIAAGEVSLATARVIAVFLPIAALGVAALTGRWQTVVVVATYLVITVTYSMYWKHIAVIDLIAVASGFVLRAAAGAVATDVPMSNWFLLVTMFGSLLIVTGKRYAERRELADGAKNVRATLGEYSEQYLQLVLGVACAGALVSYCQWAFEVSDIAKSSLPFYELSIAPMLAALLRYLLVLDQGRGAAPEEVFASDRVLQLLGLCWVVVFGLAVYT